MPIKQQQQQHYTNVAQQKQQVTRPTKTMRMFLLPFSQSWPLNPGIHKHWYSLSVKPAWQDELFWQGFFAQAFFKEKKNEK